MKCPNCKSNIPDDSRYCHDCCHKIEHEHELRKEARSIFSLYKKGYEFLLKQNQVPPYSDYLSIEGYKLIIAKKSEIIKVHNGIVASEEHQKIIELQHQQEIELRKRIEEENKRNQQKKNESFSFISLCITLIVCFFMIRSVYYGGNYDDAFERGIVHGANDQDKFITVVPIFAIFIGVPIYYLVKVIINKIIDSSN